MTILSTIRPLATFTPIATSHTPTHPPKITPTPEKQFLGVTDKNLTDR